MVSNTNKSKARCNKTLEKENESKNLLDNIVNRLSSYNFKCPGNIERARQHRLLHSLLLLLKSRSGGWGCLPIC